MKQGVNLINETERSFHSDMAYWQYLTLEGNYIGLYKHITCVCVCRRK